jgi:hypothetical protein
VRTAHCHHGLSALRATGRFEQFIDESSRRENLGTVPPGLIVVLSGALCRAASAGFMFAGGRGRVPNKSRELSAVQSSVDRAASSGLIGEECDSPVHATERRAIDSTWLPQCASSGGVELGSRGTTPACALALA